MHPFPQRKADHGVDQIDRQQGVVLVAAQAFEDVIHLRVDFRCHGLHPLSLLAVAEARGPLPRWRPNETAAITRPSARISVPSSYTPHGAPPPPPWRHTVPCVRYGTCAARPIEQRHLREAVLVLQRHELDGPAVLRPHVPRRRHQSLHLHQPPGMFLAPDDCRCSGAALARRRRLAEQPEQRRPQHEAQRVPLVAPAGAAADRPAATSRWLGPRRTIHPVLPSPLHAREGMREKRPIAPPGTAPAGCGR